MIINSENKKIFQICLLVLIAIVVLGIGYASITAINLIINSNATASVNNNNFKVHFIEAKEINGTTGVGGTSVIETDDTKASFNVTGLSKTGDYAEAKYVVKNDSAGIGTIISLDLTSSNQEYFKITETIDDNKLQAGEETFATVKIEMIKTPINDSISTNVVAKIISTPLEDSSATGGKQLSKITGEPESFETDSWATIKKAVQTGNTSKYNIGDTKTVTINNTNYTVRIANKSINEKCSNEDYSETACGFVVEFTEIITMMKMRDSQTNIGGYPATNIYNYLSTLYGQLPPDLQSSIISTRVISGLGCTNGNWDGGNFLSCNTYDNNGINYITNDKLYLLSGNDLYGTDKLGYDLYDTAANTTTQLDYYKNKSLSSSIYSGTTNSSEAYKKYDGVTKSWWLRSASGDKKISFTSVYRGEWDKSNATSNLGVSPAFRIG